jgi:hypothetical protein
MVTTQGRAVHTGLHPVGQSSSLVAQCLTRVLGVISPCVHFLGQDEEDLK